MEQVSNNELSDFEAATMTKTNGTINVLTILTFIGCAFQLIGVFAAKWLMSFAVKAANDPNLLEAMSPKERQQMQQAKEMVDLYNQYQIPLIAMSLVGMVLCFYGALQMRKLKKQGFYAYVVGEWLPIIGSAVLMGFAMQFNGFGSIVFSFVIPALFTTLYALQLKWMK